MKRLIEDECPDQTVLFRSVLPTGFPKTSHPCLRRVREQLNLRMRAWPWSTSSVMRFGD